ncbi:uncharacterized protein [Anabrus simplex]|uniref:uncharacterized protein n=1 Tax=Anabrus simplex TaxID=316456 RepID=UPI0035A38294
MVGKLTIAVVVEMCLFQGLNARSAPKHGTTRDVIDDIIDDALKKAHDVLDDVVAETKKSMETSVATLEKAVEGINSGLHTSVEEAEQVIKGLGDNIVAQIEKLLQDAGLNATACAQGKDEEAKKVVDDAVDSIGTCISNAERAGEVIKLDFEMIVNVTESQLDVMESGVVSCVPENVEHSLAEANKIAKCLAQEVMQIRKMNKELLHTLAKFVSHEHNEYLTTVDYCIHHFSPLVCYTY